MSFLSKIKDLGTSATTLSRLCGKSWDLLESDNRVTYIFKTNKQLHCVVNGKSAVIPYEFVPDSSTLIIYYSGVGGRSYHLKHVDDKALILAGESDGKDSCFTNRNSKNAPSTVLEAYKCQFSKQIEYIRYNAEKYKSFSYHDMIDDVDKVIEGLDGNEQILLVDVLRKYVDGFNWYYIKYLGYYCKTHDPDFDEQETYRRLGVFFLWHGPSATLDYYIQEKDESINQYRLVNR